MTPKPNVGGGIGLMRFLMDMARPAALTFSIGMVCGAEAARVAFEIWYSMNFDEVSW